MRGVVDRGTGAGIRQKWGLASDLAGKTGTTQDNTDGWFILMHPQLVAGAWVGFDDNRVTMRGSWGQGAHSALHIVGDFFQQTLKASYIDPKARFTAPHQQEEEQPLVNRMGNWFSNLFQGAAPPPAQSAPPQYPPQAMAPPPQPLFIAPRSAATDASGQDLGVPRTDTGERGWPIIRSDGAGSAEAPATQ